MRNGYGPTLDDLKAHALNVSGGKLLKDIVAEMPECLWEVPQYEGPIRKGYQVELIVMTRKDARALLIELRELRDQVSEVKL